jgi:hypothetical protein
MRLAYAVQDPLQREFGQKKIEVFFFGPGSIEKGAASRMRRCLP